ncbi:hypothetical protein [Massilia sp. YIM B04103]|uniref:hypothetical protein n=1 Tax=Massilia sp. YIM B04103 TaxID=2963106 RepID=UPI00210A98B8|nr:hypothetical protein [Massilia sp. YIM B04103]
MQIVQRSSPNGIAAGQSGSASQVDAAGLKTAADTAAAPVTGSGTAAPLRRGISNLDQPLQNDISGAQQAVDFLEQSAAQLRALKTELAGRLASRQQRDGQVEARLRQFNDTWRSRSEAAGGTLDPQLEFSSSEPAVQRFTVRGMSMANLRSGARETLAISLNGSAQNLRSLTLTPGLSDGEIVARFNQTLAPAGMSVSVNDAGELIFVAEEALFPAIREGFSVQGGGIRFPAGQLNRIKTEEEAPIITPEGWGASDVESIRRTLQQVMQALSHVEAALAKVNAALYEASHRAAAAMAEIDVAGIDEAALRFADVAKEPSYSNLLALNSALVGISRDRVVSLLRLSA